MRTFTRAFAVVVVMGCLSSAGWAGVFNDAGNALGKGVHTVAHETTYVVKGAGHVVGGAAHFVLSGVDHLFKATVKGVEAL